MTVIKKITKKLGFDIVRSDNPALFFQSHHYLRHNARRLEHLASLKLPLKGQSVLEVGAGIGDHTHFYLDRGNKVTITEERSENLVLLKKRYPGADIQFLDMENPVHVKNGPFEIVHCYGLLYHLGNPERALKFLSSQCTKMMLLETCVSFGDTLDVNLVAENKNDPTQASSGTGCRPTRAWLFDKLSKLFEHVYVPTTQPNHEEFPVDWSAPEKHKGRLSRAVFVCSRQKIDNGQLTEGLTPLQTRHE